MGGSPRFPLEIHQPASLSIWPAGPVLQRDLSTSPGGVYLDAAEEMMDIIWRRFCVSMIFRRVIYWF